MKNKGVLNLILLLVAYSNIFAQDTTTKVLDDEYRIRPSINIDFFSTKQVGLIAKSKKLKEVNYAFSEFSVGFYTPILSINSKKIAENKTYKSNFTLLATGSFVKSKPFPPCFSRIKGAVFQWQKKSLDG
jgi:hypothetical protein